ncbi:MAG: hypothetical protein ISR59_03200 [Anaerolineales bacterium]|uniref:Uncharacterized protein n=1 Tax=Candidatus Desulfolinea nitratireducens TaxID=2841698 RepID=A0A8J6NHN7_9CHLR|nr:hypothetical protein [Candidatus Desulfolinea nitratireducens]MBL6960090.1 hypothetical protein [Anaerolineales bacterium]
MITFAKKQTLTTTHRTLKILAVLVWVIGGVMLIRKGSELLIEAYSLNSIMAWIGFSIALGVILGSLKSKYLFVKSCRKNLVRIDALEDPRLWQFYRPKFFLFLTLMIGTGVTLSRMAHGSFPFLLSVAALDLSIATALLSSSVVYWQEKAFSK